MRRISYPTLILVLIVVGIAAAAIAVQRFSFSLGGTQFSRGSNAILGLQLGLDLQGGSHLVYEAEEGATNDEMEAVMVTIRRRVDSFGVTEPVIQRLGERRILVQLPGVGDTRINVDFQQPVNAEDIEAALSEMGKATERIQRHHDRSFTLVVGFLLAEERDQQGNVTRVAESETIRKTLEEKFGALDSYQVTGGVEVAKRLIGQTAILELKERDCLAEPCDLPGNFEDKETGLTGADLVRSFAGTHPTTSVPVVNFEFRSGAARTFAELTTRLNRTQGRIAIYLDNEPLIAPAVQSPILTGQGFIEGSSVDPFTAEEARTLAIQLQSGSLRVPIKIVTERSVDAILGKDSLKDSLVAGLIGLAIVFLFMAAYYRASGLVAGTALTLYVVIVLGVFKLVPVTLTLAGIAALIISIGMAVDANVLIFERMKEELRAGRSIFSAMQVGFNRAWPAIRDSNVTTFITCAILFWFGSRLGLSLVTGFAVTLFIGVATSMFTAITVSRLVLTLAAMSPVGRWKGLFTPESLAKSGEGKAKAAAQEGD